jgi:hypothetical protein
MLRPVPDGTLRTWPVSTRVNTPRNNDAGLRAPLMKGRAEHGKAYSLARAPHR